MFTIVAAVIVGAIFSLSAVMKLRNFRHYIKALRAYHLVAWPPALAVIGVVIVISELVVGALLLTGTALSWASTLAGLLLILFTLIVMQSLLRGQAKASCGCMAFGREHPVGWYIVTRNIGLLFLLVSVRFEALQAIMIAAGIVVLVMSWVTIDVNREHTHLEKVHQDNPSLKEAVSQPASAR